MSQKILFDEQMIGVATIGLSIDTISDVFASSSLIDSSSSITYVITDSATVLQSSISSHTMLITEATASEEQIFLGALDPCVFQSLVSAEIIVKYSNVQCSSICQCYDYYIVEDSMLSDFYVVSDDTISYSIVSFTSTCSLDYDFYIFKIPEMNIFIIHISDLSSPISASSVSISSSNHNLIESCLSDYAFSFQTEGFSVCDQCPSLTQSSYQASEEYISGCLDDVFSVSLNSYNSEFLFLSSYEIRLIIFTLGLTILAIITIFVLRKICDPSLSNCGKIRGIITPINEVPSIPLQQFVSNIKKYSKFEHSDLQKPVIKDESVGKWLFLGWDGVSVELQPEVWSVDKLAAYYHSKKRNYETLTCITPRDTRSFDEVRAEMGGWLHGCSIEEISRLSMNVWEDIHYIIGYIYYPSLKGKSLSDVIIDYFAEIAGAESTEIEQIDCIKLRCKNLASGLNSLYGMFPIPIYIWIDGYDEDDYKPILVESTDLVCCDFDVLDEYFTKSSCSLEPNLPRKPSIDVCLLSSEELPTLMQEVASKVTNTLIISALLYENISNSAVWLPCDIFTPHGDVKAELKISSTSENKTVMQQHLRTNRKFRAMKVVADVCFLLHLHSLALNFLKIYMEQPKDDNLDISLVFAAETKACIFYSQGFAPFAEFKRKMEEEIAKDDAEITKQIAEITKQIADTKLKAESKEKKEELAKKLEAKEKGRELAEKKLREVKIKEEELVYTTLGLLNECEKNREQLHDFPLTLSLLKLRRAQIMNDHHMASYQEHLDVFSSCRDSINSICHSVCDKYIESSLPNALSHAPEFRQVLWTFCGLARILLLLVRSPHKRLSFLVYAFCSRVFEGIASEIPILLAEEMGLHDEKVWMNFIHEYSFHITACPSPFKFVLFSTHPNKPEAHHIQEYHPWECLKIDSDSDVSLSLVEYISITGVDVGIGMGNSTFIICFPEVREAPLLPEGETIPIRFQWKRYHVGTQLNVIGVVIQLLDASLDAKTKIVKKEIIIPATGFVSLSASYQSTSTVSFIPVGITSDISREVFGEIVGVKLIDLSSSSIIHSPIKSYPIIIIPPVSHVHFHKNGQMNGEDVEISHLPPSRPRNVASLCLHFTVSADVTIKCISILNSSKHHCSAEIISSDKGKRERGSVGTILIEFVPYIASELGIQITASRLVQQSSRERKHHSFDTAIRIKIPVEDSVQIHNSILDVSNSLRFTVTNPQSTPTYVKARAISHSSDVVLLTPSSSIQFYLPLALSKDDISHVLKLGLDETFKFDRDILEEFEKIGQILESECRKILCKKSNLVLDGVKVQDFPICITSKVLCKILGNPINISFCSKKTSDRIVGNIIVRNQSHYLLSLCISVFCFDEDVIACGTKNSKGEMRKWMELNAFSCIKIPVSFVLLSSADHEFYVAINIVSAERGHSRRRDKLLLSLDHTYSQVIPLGDTEGKELDLF
ncbi:hypothetical protein ADUPG1_008178 [Aduncisulcus paluster]|uniref:Uncharacterized protein n=1 Tax=Aduncisulcus paluster TaxID=2918883 RepID=A0ABQ5KU14_9EUKA|nr:hypothetical protein ADUPG1_008178 [Aduncisulcus paluster]